jgi:hypothetical protein
MARPNWVKPSPPLGFAAVARKTLALSLLKTRT